MEDKKPNPPTEPPILFTDNIVMTTNPDGLTLDVLQRSLGAKGFRVLVRLGMSREHAKKFVVKLSRLLAMTEGNSQTREERGN